MRRVNLAFWTLVLLSPLRAPSAAQGSFPFAIQGDRFLLNGVPVFLNVIGYQPLEPDQIQGSEIRVARVLDDYAGGRRIKAAQIRYSCASTPSRPRSFRTACRSSETACDLFTLQLPAPTPVVSGVSADDATLLPNGTTAVHATVAPQAAAPIRFRWESSRGRIVGDGASVHFHAGGQALGPATITVVGIDANSRASVASTSIAIQSVGPVTIDILAAGRGHNATQPIRRAFAGSPSSTSPEITTLYGGRLDPAGATGRPVPSKAVRPCSITGHRFAPHASHRG